MISRVYQWVKHQAVMQVTPGANHSIVTESLAFARVVSLFARCAAAVNVT